MDNDYIMLCGYNRIFFNATKLPEYEKKNFYESIYDTDPTIKGIARMLDEAGEECLVDTILDKIPDELAPYKKPEYKLEFWYCIEDNNGIHELIELADKDFNWGIFVKLH